MILNEVTATSQLYHRSPHLYRVGQVLYGVDKEKKGYKVHYAELALEEYRKRYFPAMPSRFDCIFSSIAPRSRFVDKGYLYLVQPIGRTLVTSSVLIDQIFDNFSRADDDRDIINRALKGDNYAINWLIRHLNANLAETYWEGVSKFKLSKLDTDNVEVLSEGVKILEVIKEPARLFIGSRVEIIEPGMPCTMDIYFNSAEARLSLTPELVDQFIDDVKRTVIDVKSEKKSDYNSDNNVVTNWSCKGTLKSGAELEASYIRSTKFAWREEEDRRRSPYDELMFDFNIDGEWYHRKEMLLLFRLTTAAYMQDYPSVYGSSNLPLNKYFKKL